MRLVEKTAPVGPEDALLARFLDRQKAGDVRHSGGALMEHLNGTATLLESWGASATVREAGRFHSIYGTESFRTAVADPADRSAVRDLIGEAAERLAYLFSAMSVGSFATAVLGDAPYEITDRFTGAAIGVTDSEMRDLSAIFTANWLEQFPRLRANARAQHVPTLRRIAGWLGGPVAQAINDAYGFDRPPGRTRPAISPMGRSPIRVVDDLVPTELQLRLSALMDRNIWRYGWRANSTQTGHGFWHSHFGGGDENSLENCEAEIVGRPLIAPVLELWRLLQEELVPGHVPVRVYANGHTYGGDGHVHRDSPQPDYFTTIYYAHPTWEPNWAGETVFLNMAGEDVVRSVFPKPGRLAHFPGNIPHAARSPSRDCPTLRAVVVFKSRLRTPDDGPGAT